MAVIAHIILPRLTREQYDAIREKTGWLEQAPEGGLSHVAWWEDDDNHNTDAWESETALQTFVESRLMPAVMELGLNVEPLVTLHPAHEVYAPKAVTVTET